MSARPSLPVMTSGRIAAANLTASIGSARRRVAREFQPPAVAELVTALLTRGGVLARVDDVLTAHRWSAALVAAFPRDGTAHLTRARTEGALHLFDAALASLDEGEARAAPARELAEERATVLQATGRVAEALRLWEAASEITQDSHVLGRLACVQAELGATDAADELFNEAVAGYPDVSPVALAGLYRDWGHLHEHAGAWTEAEASYRRAVAILPCHARAQLGTAIAEARSGRLPAAIARLRPVCDASDDPTYAGTLGLLLLAQGPDPEADDLLDRAHHRFDQLLALHPEAFAAHAAEFRQAEADLLGAASRRHR
ncbi:hypothetical protein ACFO3J_35005 [Streptomyces polygonati]|uniref:Tetratricopeptide repeat protein n=1 Tax=Streptomyces polygonati TaxID=1617087 RepID=A0ABV8I0B3_9ACTN